MARPRRCRRVCDEPPCSRFAPWGRETTETVVLTVDEYEVLRLVDYCRMTHAQCAQQMGVARSTITEIYERARYQLADCLVNGKGLTIVGGDYRLCQGGAGCGQRCRWETVPDGNTRQKGPNEMRIAVTYEDGQVFQHFGHTQQMKLYDVEGTQVVHQQVVDTTGSGHGALAGFLAGHGVDTLICGGIGGGAQMALASAGIALYGGVNGSADAAVAALLEGRLAYDPAVHCDHHHHDDGHDCGEDHACGQGCGEDKHGCLGNH